MTADDMIGFSELKLWASLSAELTNQLTKFSSQEGRFTPAQVSVDSRLSEIGS
jgi:hypothetical protein